MVRFDDLPTVFSYFGLSETPNPIFPVFHEVSSNLGLWLGDRVGVEVEGLGSWSGSGIGFG